MTIYKIKKNIPIPVGDWKRDQYPLSEMVIGDCFDIIFATDQKLQRKPITDFEKLNPSFKFLAKKIGLKQYRVWRIPANDEQEKKYIEELNGKSQASQEVLSNITKVKSDNSEKSPVSEKKYRGRKPGSKNKPKTSSTETLASSSQAIVGKM